jgi:putative addiction module killer protein
MRSKLGARVPGWYFVRRGRVIVVLLNAGDKSTQQRDIRSALKPS